MIRVVLAPDKGGNFSFDHVAEARAWASMEEARLAEMVNSIPLVSHVPELIGMVNAWMTLEKEIAKAARDHREDFDVEAPQNAVVVASVAGRAIRIVGEKMGPIALRGAIFSANIPVADVDWSRLDTVAGMQAYSHYAEIYRQEDQDPVPAAVRGKLFEFQQQIDNMRTRMSAVNAEVSNTARLVSSSTQQAEGQLAAVDSKIALKTAEYDTEIAGITSKYLKFEAENAEQINGHGQRLERHLEDAQVKLAAHDDRVEKKLNEHLEDARAKLDAWSNAQMEKIQLEAPVRLWNRRGREHRRAARNLARASVGVGIAGTIVTPLVWYAAFEEAQALLATPAAEKAKPVTNAGAKAGMPPTTNNATTGSASSVPTVRPTLHFELIFAGAATLFWLTMFFWLMRILVRRYSAEQRLFNDASGRAAMTQTYIGLTAKERAKKTERPIILGALFQPVNDGAASDDGPPATSMASIVAAIVAGKN